MVTVCLPLVEKEGKVIPLHGRRGEMDIYISYTPFGHFVRLGGKVGDLVTYKCLKFKVTEITLDQACAQCLEYKDFNEHFTAEESLNKFIMQRSHEEMLNE